MFTGLIEEIGTIESAGTKLKISAEKILEDIKLGDSICVNGACLTTIDFGKRDLTVEVMPETLRCTNLGELKKGSKVNLERAMSANGRFGGHIVSGHIDGTGTIADIYTEGIAVVYTISAAPDVLKYIIYKGSVTVDGISLTVCYADDSKFSVSTIPHTRRGTTLPLKKIGDTVNLETDVIAGYIEKFLGISSPDKKESNIDMDFLKKCGFL